MFPVRNSAALKLPVVVYYHSPGLEGPKNKTLQCKILRGEGLTKGYTQTRGQGEMEMQVVLT